MNPFDGGGGMSKRTAGIMNGWGLVGAAALVVGLVLMGTGCAMTPRANEAQIRFVERRAIGADENIQHMAVRGSYWMNVALDKDLMEAAAIAQQDMAESAKLSDPAEAATSGWAAALAYTETVNHIESLRASESRAFSDHLVVGRSYNSDAGTLQSEYMAAQEASRKFWRRAGDDALKLGTGLWAQYQEEKAEQARLAEIARITRDQDEREARLKQMQRELESHEPGEPSPVVVPPLPSPDPPAAVARRPFRR